VSDLAIQHNLYAHNAYRLVNTNNNILKDNQEKLSSGYRINRAGDDAAGLAISEKMRSQIHSLERAKRNCNDGMLLVQTAEGALSTVHSMLQRMTELAEQSANGTYDDAVDRSALQLEMSQLKDEINQIAESTKFGNIYLLDGTLSEEGIFDIGQKMRPSYTPPAPGNTITIFVYDEVTHDVTAAQTPSGSATMSGYNDLKTALKDQIVPQAVKAVTDTFAETFGYLSGSSIGIGLDLYSDSGSSVLASVGVGAGGALNDINLTYTLKVNMAHLDMDADGNLTSQSREDLEATIAHEMMHALMDEAHTAGMLGRNDDWYEIAPFPDWFVEGAAQTVGGARDWVNSIGIDSGTSTGEITNILSNSSHKIVSGSTSSQYASGYLAVMYLGYTASGSVTASGLADGIDKILQELKAGASLDTVINDLTGCTDTTEFENRFAIIGADFIAELMAETENGRGSLADNDLKENDLLPDADYNDMLFALNTSNTKVDNDYPDGYNVMSGGGRSLDGVSPDGSTPKRGGLRSKTYNGFRDNGTGQGLVMQIGTSTKDTMNMYIDSVSTTSLGINDIDLSTQEEASTSIDIIQDAVNKISVQRAALGAYQNRIEHKIESISVTYDNLNASESAIRDTDMASEISDFVVNKIRLEASTALLAQANTTKQSILSIFAS